jgi:methionine synthase I (cobalamin-dependent)
MPMDNVNEFPARLREGDMLWDGGMGSALINQGLEPGAPPEQWNLDHREAVREVHRQYVLAGADVVTTNSFGSTPSRLRGYGLEADLADINNAAVSVAREAAAGNGRDVFVAFSVGPTGKMLPPVGGATEGEIEEEFLAQLECVTQPVDVFLGETFFDLREALLFLKAFSSARSGPGDYVGVTMTFNRTPRGFFTVMGNTVTESVAGVVDSGALFAGANCSLTSPDMVDLADELRTRFECPLLCQPNAGDPSMEEGRPVYRQRPEDFAADAARMSRMGINAVGGCCGTDSRFIRATAELTRSGRRQA